MKFDLTREDDLVIFHLRDTSLDSTNSAEIKKEFLIICQPDVSVLIADLSDVTFCDSTGLSSLLLAERQMREHGGGVLIIDPIGRVRSLIEISKLEAVFPVFPTIEEAKASLEE